MSVCTRKQITGNNRERSISVVSPSDFTTEAETEIDAPKILQDPRFTVYCLDPENNAVHFVESNDSLAVDRAPFYYQGQVDHAVGLASMPLETFHQLAKEIPHLDTIFIHSVGRCGSTLLSKLLAAVPEVHSLSEPDDLTQMANFRTQRRLSDHQIQSYLESSVRWRGKPRAGAPAKFVAIKPRSEVLVLADLIGQSFTHAKHLFLYRNAMSWMKTIFKGFPLDWDVYDVERNKRAEASWSKTLPLIRDSVREDFTMNPVQIRIQAWITCMEGYLVLADLNLATQAVRYEDLTTNPKPIMETIFQFLGIESVDWNEMEEVLGRDSQAGTSFDREERKKLTRELTPALIKDLEDSIANHPGLATPDVFVPGTILADLVAD